jgi:hypothetical protein
MPLSAAQRKSKAPSKAQSPRFDAHCRNMNPVRAGADLGRNGGLGFMLTRRLFIIRAAAMHVAAFAAAGAAESARADDSSALAFVKAIFAAYKGKNTKGSPSIPMRSCGAISSQRSSR